MQIVSLHGHQIPERAPDKNCVELLERLLQQAKSGEIVGVCCAAAHYDGCATPAVAGVVDSYSLLGATEVAKARLAKIVGSER